MIETLEVRKVPVVKYETVRRYILWIKNMCELSIFKEP